MLSVPINNIEQLFISVSIGEIKLILGAVYIPSSSNLDLYDNHIQSVEFLQTKYTAHEFIIAGDFNISSARSD